MPISPLRALVVASVMLAAASSARPTVSREFIRGVVVSCPRWGPVWGSSDMARSLEELKALGVEWVAIHPYAWLRKNGEVESRPARELDFLPRAVQLADAAGLQLFWKPHLGYWGSFTWRGDIAFGDDETAWQRFFEGYRVFIVDQARFAQAAGVKLFAVGVEYEKTTGRETEWRRIITAVREVYQGKITYAANWNTLERVPFWDAVDLIGVHAYFPLSGVADPDRETLWRGWDRHLARLRDLSTRHGGKPILFAEIGYNRSLEAARTPWTRAMDDRPAIRRLRQRLFEVALVRIEGEPAVAGMFWWKWIPGPALFDRDFSMKDPEARQALARSWGDRPMDGAKEVQTTSGAE